MERSKEPRHSNPWSFYRACNSESMTAFRLPKQDSVPVCESPMIQRGFRLPSPPSFTIDPSILSNKSRDRHAEPDSLYADLDDGSSTGYSYFKAPWSNPDSLVEGANAGSAPMSGQGSCTAHDEFTEALQSLVSKSHLESPRSSRRRHSGSLGSSNANVFDTRGLSFNFHGYTRSPTSAPVPLSPVAATSGLDPLPPELSSPVATYSAKEASSWKGVQDITACATPTERKPSSSGLELSLSAGGVHEAVDLPRTGTQRATSRTRQLPANSFGLSTSLSNTSTPSLVASSISTIASTSVCGSLSTAATTLSEEGGERQGRRISPNDPEKPRGRNASTGRAPPSRPSRSRTRRPSYSRTISPRGLPADNRPSTTSNSAKSPPMSTVQMPGYPHLQSSNGQGTATYISGYAGSNGYDNSQIPRYSTSLQGYSMIDGTSASWNNGVGVIPPSGNFPFAAPSAQQRRQSDVGSFAPSSFGESPLMSGLPVVEEGNRGGQLATYPFSTSISPPLRDDLETINEDNTYVQGYLRNNSKADLNYSGKRPPEDKRKKRRESHNAVERRRRDNINERIAELATLIPEILLDPIANGSAGVREQSANGESPSAIGQEVRLTGSPPMPNQALHLTPAQIAQVNSVNKPNKGIILTKGVEYIRYLQQLVQLQADRNRELEKRLQMMEHGGGLTEHSYNDHGTTLRPSNLAPASQSLGHLGSGSSMSTGSTPLHVHPDDDMFRDSPHSMRLEEYLGMGAISMDHSPIPMEAIHESMAE
ncbi:hypothetical protein EMMF5_000501 [Cystobasidiomycetes sp. EMM_F5]